MEKFTKGPWHADKDFKAIYNAQCNYICDWPLNNEHDKYLIAAAPEMYAALKTLLDDDAVECDYINDIDLLLAKARGEQ